MAAYVPDPATLETALQLEEIEELAAAGPRALKDRRTFDHVLSRMATTLRLNRSEFNRLHRQVTTIAAERQHQGVPTSLDPLSAARFVPPEELNRLASANLRAKHAQLDAALAEFADVQRKVTGRVNAIKFAVASLLEDDTVAPETRQRFLELVRALPDPTPEALPTAVLESVALRSEHPDPDSGAHRE